VLLTGRRVETVGYAPGDTRSDAALVRPEPLAPRSNGSSGGNNVLELSDWNERENSAPPPPRGPEDDSH